MFQTEQEQADFLLEQYNLFSVFKDNKILIKVLRKSILGIELSPTEEDLKKQIPQAVIARIEKMLLPKVTGDEEMNMMNDFWFQFNLKERNEYQVSQDIKYLPLVWKFFNESLNRLKGEDAKLAIKDVEFSENKCTEDNIVNVIARNIILATTEGTLSTIYRLANTKPLTAEEIKAQSKKNSTK